MLDGSCELCVLYVYVVFAYASLGGISRWDCWANRLREVVTGEWRVRRKGEWSRGGSGLSRVDDLGLFVNERR